MKITDGARTVAPDARDETCAATGETGPYSPGQFFWEAGILIAVCLALGLLARLLLA